MKKSGEREAVIVGALLHDIGKFVQRAKDDPKKPSKNHSKWGVEWTGRVLGGVMERLFSEHERYIIEEAINNHHDIVRYITLADITAAGMERIESGDEEGGDPFHDRLISVFSRLSLSEHKPAEHYQKIERLGKTGFFEEAFPTEDKKCSQDEYKILLEEFEKEIKEIEHLDKLCPRRFIEILNFLLWKYTWCIPGAVYRSEPDISLFDHLKVTAAIATCLYDYHRFNNKEASLNDKAFIIVGGDVSGIQSYIFSVLSQSGKVAKRLRARSLYIQMLSEIAAHKILHAFDLPLCNVISSAGGNFYLLVPYKGDDTDGVLEELQKRFEQWTYEKLRAEVYLSLRWRVTSGRELRNFGKLLRSDEGGNWRSPNSKYSAFRTMLTDEQKKWDEKKFVMNELIEGDEKICVACRKHPTAVPEGLCRACHNDERIGKILPAAKYLAFFNDSEHEFPVFDYSFELWQDEKQGEKPYLLVEINNLEATARRGFRFMANHVPTYRDTGSVSEMTDSTGHPAPFDFIARMSEGDSQIAYVKADVDNLGRLLSEGFTMIGYPMSGNSSLKSGAVDVKSQCSISRFCSLSRMLELFFAGYLHRKMEDKYRDIYTVFSGGDDFYIIGPWNRAIDFAREIRRDFSRYTGMNPDITFSAGVVLAKPHEPVALCSELVECELDKSKKTKRNVSTVRACLKATGEILACDQNKDRNVRGKDRITVFGETIRWFELDELIMQARKLKEWLERKIVTRSFLQRVYKYGEMKKLYERTGKMDYLRWVPLFSYDINRNLNRDFQKDAREWAIDLLLKMQNAKQGSDSYLRATVEYVLISTRGEKK